MGSEARKLRKDASLEFVLKITDDKHYKTNDI